MKDSILGPWANLDERLIRNPAVLQRKLDAFRELKAKIGLTSGAFDMLHIGHSRYLALARQACDILIVGVDTDEKIRRRKGPKRPIVSEEERFEIVCHTRYADIVVPKAADEPQWNLIKIVQPDVLVISEREYTKPEDRSELETVVAGWGGKLHVLPSQAETSTTARFRTLLVENLDEVEEQVQMLFKRLRGAAGGSD
ncbi:MAG: adenylyltransferase/cytidyltransferase family protein [Candidatus Sungbacteria bacterium]|uniref:Adenylyltransferase/cytidyltransferase family protein n=1 Tax=Candidatus Sungiibacteriota bacterium TaxID=2750080 RepID=A0A931WP22_9BACT|nr:adenylyltransferase/cytidyltransferase family protein [Candidatus Sungbacteria bacterium]